MKAVELPAGSDTKPKLLPIHLVNTDPPYNVRVEPRSNNAIAAGLSSFGAPALTHHQGFDLARRPEIAKPTPAKLRPKDRPQANDFVSDDEFDRLLHAWFGNISRVSPVQPRHRQGTQRPKQAPLVSSGAQAIGGGTYE